MTTPITVVVGGQWGSEGKGEFSAYLARKRGSHFVVRTGAINAGHTVHYDGKAYKNQQIPTAWTIPSAKLIIGPGAYVNPGVLEREIQWAVEAGFPHIKDRLFIDHRAGVHTSEHKERAEKSGRHHRFGATGEGGSEAMVDKIRNRANGGMLFKDTTAASRFQLVDTVALLNQAYDRGQHILLEGTQGALLDIHLGSYPYTTSRQTNAAAWVSEAGLSPAMEFEVVMVVRTMPIRVAGNSGPMPGETSWIEVAREWNAILGSAGRAPIVDPAAVDAFESELRSVGVQYGCPDFLSAHEWPAHKREQYKVLLSEGYRDALRELDPEQQKELSRVLEFTTVTKKLRRIAMFSLAELERAVMYNRPSSICLSFLNYVYPEIWGVKEWKQVAASGALDWLQVVERAGVPVEWVTTGPGPECILPV